MFDVIIIRVQTRVYLILGAFRDGGSILTCPYPTLADLAHPSSEKYSFTGPFLTRVVKHDTIFWRMGSPELERGDSGLVP